jgi:hypothetical protein
MADSSGVAIYVRGVNVTAIGSVPAPWRTHSAARAQPTAMPATSGRVLSKVCMTPPKPASTSDPAVDRRRRLLGKSSAELK